LPAGEVLTPLICRQSLELVLIANWPQPKKRILRPMLLSLGNKKARGRELAEVSAPAAY